jgi:hypothetical protein
MACYRQDSEILVLFVRFNPHLNLNRISNEQPQVVIYEKRFSREGRLGSEEYERRDSVHLSSSLASFLY